MPQVVNIRSRKAAKNTPHRPQRRWLLLGLFFLSAITALLSASRRSRFERRWEEVDELDPFEPQATAEERRPRPTVPSVARPVAGAGGELFVDDGGVGEPPVLFVHGLGGSSGQWRSQLTHLRPSRRALALDLRGHGDSEAAGSYRIADLAADVTAVADALDLERFVLAGHSLGASVALEVAAAAPERVAGILLVDPNGDQTKIPPGEMDSFLAALGKDPRGEMEWYFKQLLVRARPEVADRVLADLALAEPEALRGALESAAGHSPLPALEGYPGPKLALLSDMNDLPYSLHRLVGDLPVRRLGGTSHWMMLDRPEEVDRALDELLAKVGE